MPRALRLSSVNVLAVATRLHCLSRARSIRRLAYGLDGRYIDPAKVALKVIAGLYDGITTRELDTLAAETCALARRD